MHGTSPTIHLPLAKRALYSTFVMLLVGSLCFSTPVITADSLPASADQVNGLKAGDQAPSFTVKTAFRTPDDMIERLKSKKQDRDLKASSIERHSALAVPSVYVIDTNGQIVYDYVNADHKLRLPADELLHVATSIAD